MLPTLSQYRPSRRSIAVAAVCGLVYTILQQRARYRIRENNSKQKLFREDGAPDFEVARRILSTLAEYEDNFLALLALRMGILRTFAIPTTATVLVKSGTFACAALKRTDDTTLLITEILERPLDHERSQMAMGRMNHIHSMYARIIPNDDMLFTLCVFLLEPIRWAKRFAWRQFTPHEEEASYHVWAEFGRRMGIDNIPDSYEAMSQWYTDFEAAHMGFHPDNVKLLHETIDNALSQMPVPMWCRSLLKRVLMWLLPALLGARASVAFGMEPASQLLVAAIEGPLFVRKYVLRFLMFPRSKPKIVTCEAKNGSDGPLYFAPSADSLYYGNKPYEILKLGPTNAVPGATKKGSEMKYRG